MAQSVVYTAAAGGLTKLAGRGSDGKAKGGLGAVGGAVDGGGGGGETGAGGLF